VQRLITIGLSHEITYEIILEWSRKNSDRFNIDESGAGGAKNEELSVRRIKSRQFEE
jgi:hypothetical protein